jgi:hypothetical protein
MRHFIPLLMACSGLALAVGAVPPQLAAATQLNSGTQLAALDAQSKESEAPGSTRVVCSRNHTLQANPEGTKVAALPEGLTWSSNVVKLFCRDIRFSTAVVKDYCAVLRE